MSTTVSSNIQ